MPLAAWPMKLSKVLRVKSFPLIFDRASLFPHQVFRRLAAPFGAIEVAIEADDGKATALRSHILIGVVKTEPEPPGDLMIHFISWAKRPITTTP